MERVLPRGAHRVVFVVSVQGQKVTAALALQLLCGASSLHLAPVVAYEAKHHHVSVAILVSVMRVESRCKSWEVGAHNERGVMQVMPEGNANYLRLDAATLANPEVNIHMGARHLQRMYRLCHTWAGALASYNGARKCRPSDYSRKVLEFSKQISQQKRS